MGLEDGRPYQTCPSSKLEGLKEVVLQVKPSSVGLTNESRPIPILRSDSILSQFVASELASSSAADQLQDAQSPTAVSASDPLERPLTSATAARNTASVTHRCRSRFTPSPTTPTVVAATGQAHRYGDSSQQRQTALPELRHHRRRRRRRHSGWRSALRRTLIVDGRSPWSHFRSPEALLNAGFRAIARSV